MKPEQQRIAIAEACGWNGIKWQRLHAGNEDYWGSKAIGRDEFATRHRLPDYLNDLNDIHRAVKTLSRNHRNIYLNILCELTREDDMDDVDADFAWCDATAPQRAEAFLRTLNLWTAEP